MAELRTRRRKFEGELHLEFGTIMTRPPISSRPLNDPHEARHEHGMLRIRSSGLLLALLFACARKEDPEPLASYGATRLSVMRSTDIHGTPIVYAYLSPGDTDDCPPLAEVKASIDGRSLLVRPGGDPRGTCFGASFQAPLVVLKDGVDFHELSIADDSASIRANVADLRSGARMIAIQDGDVLRMKFDRDVRGKIETATVTWSGTVHGEATFGGQDITARIPREVATSGRVVVQADVIIDLEIGACEGISACEGLWFVHEVLDVSLAR